MKLCEIEKVDEIELAPSVKKRDLSPAAHLEYALSKARSRNLIVSQSTLSTDKNYQIVLAKAESTPGSIQAILFDPSKDDRVVAVVELFKYSRYGYQVNETKVRPAYQGQGIGLKLYKALIKDFDITLASGPIQSLGGAKLWSALYRSPGITVYGHDPRNTENKFFHVDIDASGKLDSLYGKDLYRDYSTSTRLLAVADKNL